MSKGSRTGLMVGIMFVWIWSSFFVWAQATNGTKYIFGDSGGDPATPGTPNFSRALGARFQSSALRKIEDYLRNEGFSSFPTGRVCFNDRAECYRQVNVCLHYDIKFNNRADLRFRSDVGANGALEVNLAIKRPHNGSAPWDLSSIDVHLRNPTTFSWCWANPLRDFTNGRVKFSEDGSTPGLTVNLLVEPVLQGGVLSIRKIGGSGVRINRMYLQFSGWPDWLINWVFNLSFIRNSLASTVETQTINALNNYLRDLMRFQGGFEGFSYSFNGSRAKIDSNGLNMYFNGGVNYTGEEAACTAGRAPWPTEPGTDPASTIESFHQTKDVGVAVRMVLANNALREAYNRGVFCYKNDASPFRVADLCSFAPEICDLINPEGEVYFDMKLLPDVSDPAQLPRLEITQPGTDGRLTVRFNGLNIQAFYRDPKTPQWTNMLCLYLDAGVEATVAFVGSAVFLRLGDRGTEIVGYNGMLLPTDIENCTGGLDIGKLLPPEEVEGFIRGFLIPFFNNTVGQVPFSTNIFDFACYRVFANGYGLGGEYTNIYASFLKARDLPGCTAPGGRTTVEIFNGPAEGSYTSNRRAGFWARAADPRGETACVDMRYASGYDAPPTGYAPAGGCPLGLYTTAPASDLADGPHVFRIQAKTLAVRADTCLPSGRPECESLVMERRFIVDATPPAAPQLLCPSAGPAGDFAVAWSSGSDALTPPERLRYMWFLENLGTGERRQSFGLLSDEERGVALSVETPGINPSALDPKAAYDFWVKTVDQAGNVSGESNRCRFITN
ncbi:MAG: hypothetical protein HYR55_16660 [Acidobacteria bacterium]|nr:hypothetical protein [Acidobacteriota bacterium]MBI3657417.1 hypothetical protein [Acidobacteriota bacterium]